MANDTPPYTLTQPFQWTEVPDSSSFERQASLLKQMPDRKWWTDFQDPYLADYIQEALQNSPSIQAALARVDQARAETRKAIADQLPSLSTGFFVGAFFLPKHLQNTLLRRRIDIFTIQASVSYELDLWLV